MPGERELLVKIYDPTGRTLVRKVIPDDGVVSKGFLPGMGGWDHEAWYYSYIYGKGTQPTLRWSAFSSPDRLASLANGQTTDHVTSPPENRYRGSLDAVPQTYRHSVCGVVTRMPEDIIRTYLVNAMIHNDNSFCCGCGDYVDSSELV